MKYIFTFFAALTASISFSQLVVSSDTVYMELIDGEFVDGQFSVGNTSLNNSIDLTWRVIEDDLNPSWLIQFCDCVACYAAPIPDSGDCDLDPNSNQFWKLQVDPQGNAISTQIFKVEIEDMMNGGKDTVTLITTAPSSVSNRIKEFGITMYPNPVQNQLRIDNNNGEAVEVLVSDLSGKQLFINTVDASGFIDFSTLENGIYFVSVKSEGVLLGTERIVKH